MKKFIASVLIGAMVLLPMPVYADDTDTRVNVSKLSFDKIETYIINYSPQVRANYKRVDDIQIPSESVKAGLELQKTLLSGQLDSYAKTIENLKGTIPDLESPLEFIPPSISEGDDATQQLIVFYQTLYISTYMNLKNVESQIASFDASRNKAAEAHYDAILQVEMGNNQVVRGAETLYLTYNNLEYQIRQFQAQAAQLRKQLHASELYQKLGLATSFHVKELENAIKELELGLKTMKDSQKTIKEQLNILFDQNHDTDLVIEEMPEFDKDLLEEMDFEKDLEEAERLSYDIRLQSNDSYLEEAAKRKFKADFKNVYDKVFDKLEALELEKLKLETIKEKYEFAKLKYDLGLISQLAFGDEELAYNDQLIKVKLAEHDLFMAYRDYEWMKKGLTVSTGQSM